jgi:hypothetical protein
VVILICAAGRACQLFRRFAALAFGFAALAGLALFALPRLVAVVAFFAGADFRGAVFVLAAVFAGLADLRDAGRLDRFADLAAAGRAAFARAGAFSIAAGAAA